MHITTFIYSNYAGELKNRGLNVEELSRESKTETAVLLVILFQRLNKYSKTRKKVEQQKDHRGKMLVSFY